MATDALKSERARRIGGSADPFVEELKSRLAAHNADAARRYWDRANVDVLIAERSAFFDTLVEDVWDRHMTPKAKRELAIFAVGGYGRCEQFPHSDIDLLIVARQPTTHREAISRFLNTLYDLNLKIGHSVRKVRECKGEAQRDITVATAIFERRFLLGSENLRGQVDKILSSPRLWPADTFFKAKRDEQEQRHRHYDNVEYGLEPNVKASPGGLRDLQTAMWVCQRKFGTTDLAELQRLGMLTAQEREWLDEGRRYLWWVRFGLHLLIDRKEDHLQFEHQRALAQKLGFADTGARLGVERFMHLYYRHVLELREVNDILLQHFDEAILRSNERPRIEPINERFRIHNNYIEVCDEEVFARTPSAMLEIFVIMANRRDISGVRAQTIRLIRNHLSLIDDDFRSDPANNKLFMDLLRAPYTLVSQLTRMRRYGVLARYLPEYGEIVGQMQHDLFHIYTVDAHTMMVIRHMRRFHYRASEEHFPVACHCVKNIPKIELLYVAGLYHDLGKGRGGDHSTLGATDAATFCRRHGLNDDDTELVAWLVTQHLLMSATAQRKDIYDPEVIHEFASVVKSEMRLDYLYALTVADINATNPTLWNNWRATLLRQLYGETRKALRRGLESPIDKQTSVRACKESAIDKLETRGVEPEEVERLWKIPSDEFFLRHTPRQVAEVTLLLQAHNVDDGPMVSLLDLKGQGSAEGATEIVLYTKDQPNLFAASVIALSQLELSVFDANIHTSADGLCLNTYVVLDENGLPLPRDPDRRARLVTHLATRLKNPENVSQGARRQLRRQLRQFTRPTDVKLSTAFGSKHSELTIIASDRPGLLATIGLLFAELNLAVLSARIATLGERVEDVFDIVGGNGNPITDPEAIYLLENTIRQRLDRQIAVEL
ncbi:MAG: [protein-PII] uridylyltransferase [Pseudomonadales bacterium]